MQYYSSVPHSVHHTWGATSHPSHWPYGAFYDGPVSPYSDYSDSSSPSSYSTSSPTPSQPCSRPSQSSRKKGSDHVARPPNAFLLFRSEFWARQKSKAKPVERDHRDISRIAGILWHEMPAADKKPYYDRAQKLRDEHKRQYPDYRLSPAPRRPRAPKRKSGLLMEKEERCRRLASELPASEIVFAAPQAIQTPDQISYPIDINFTASPSPQISQLSAVQPCDQPRVATPSDYSHLAPNLQQQIMTAHPKPMYAQDSDCSTLGFPIANTASPSALAYTPEFLASQNPYDYSDQALPQSYPQCTDEDLSPYPSLPNAIFPLDELNTLNLPMPESEMWSAYTNQDQWSQTSYFAMQQPSPSSSCTDSPRSFNGSLELGLDTSVQAWEMAHGSPPPPPMYSPEDYPFNL